MILGPMDFYSLLLFSICTAVSMTDSTANEFNEHILHDRHAKMFNVQRAERMPSVDCQKLSETSEKHVLFCCVSGCV